MLFTSALAVLIGAVAAVPTGSGLAPSGHEVAIEAVRYSGSGCPDQTVSSLLSDDLTTLTLGFDKFIVSSGPGVAVPERRKNCQIGLKLRYPQGWQFSLMSADYRGYAHLEQGSRGICQSTYYFSGHSGQCTTTMNFRGPFDGNYEKVDNNFPVFSEVWSPCGEQGMLNINTEIRIVPLNTRKENLMTVDSQDVKFTQVYYLQWNQCH